MPDGACGLPRHRPRMERSLSSARGASFPLQGAPFRGPARLGRKLQRRHLLSPDSMPGLARAAVAAVRAGAARHYRAEQLDERLPTLRADKLTLLRSPSLLWRHWPCRKLVPYRAVARITTMAAPRPTAVPAISVQTEPTQIGKRRIRTIPLHALVGLYVPLRELQRRHPQAGRGRGGRAEPWASCIWRRFR